MGDASQIFPPSEGVPVEITWYDTQICIQVKPDVGTIIKRRPFIKAASCVIGLGGDGYGPLRIVKCVRFAYG